MPNQHKHDPVSFRPGIMPGDPAGDREWLLEHAEATGRPVGAIVSEALAEYRLTVAEREGSIDAPATP